MENNNVTDPVYYVTEEGSDTNTGENISRSFASLNYAVSQATDLLLSTLASTFETLPIVIPDYVSIVGDNMRTTTIKPDTGNASNVQELTLTGTVADEYKVDGLVSATVKHPRPHMFSTAKLLVVTMLSKFYHLLRRLDNC